MTRQSNLFEPAERDDKTLRGSLEGFRYVSDLISSNDEQSLIARVRELPLREFDFHGYKGKRRVVSFGWQYDFAGGGQLRKAGDVPDFLLGLRSLAASFAGLESEQLEHVLVTEYAPGAGIGWHRDKVVFGRVVGVSLLSPCVLRFRRKLNEKLSQSRVGSNAWERVNVLTEQRSAYLLTGPSRAEWEHSILGVDSLRYSITFRSMVEK